MVDGACGVADDNRSLAFSEQTVAGRPSVGDREGILLYGFPPVKVSVFSVYVDRPHEKSESD